jgi:hypothetical protein
MLKEEINDMNRTNINTQINKIQIYLKTFDLKFIFVNVHIIQQICACVYQYMHLFHFRQKHIS